MEKKHLQRRPLRRICRKRTTVAKSYAPFNCRLTMTQLTHLNSRGEAQMVDVSEKNETSRSATAEATVRLGREAIEQLTSGDNPKGDVLATVRIAGIQAAKRCSDLIPLCHPLPLSKVAIDIDVDAGAGTVRIEATCRTRGVTGVEMEALTAASVAALTLYDMCKAIDKGILIERVRLLSKSGGKSGDWTAGPGGY